MSPTCSYCAIGGSFEKKKPRMLCPIFLLILILVTLGIYVTSGIWTEDLGRNSVPWCCGSVKRPVQHHALGPQARIFKTPQNLTADAGLQFSLFHEAQYLTKVSPYLHVSTDGVNSELYGVSMYHQLHCLEALRDAISSPGHETHDHQNTERVGKLADHLIHCIDYISQAVVCTADDTIEGSSRLSSGGEPIIDGGGVVHYCRDSTLVRKLVEQSMEGPLFTSELKDGDTVSMLLEEQSEKHTK